MTEQLAFFFGTRARPAWSRRRSKSTRKPFQWLFGSFSDVLLRDLRGVGIVRRSSCSSKFPPSLAGLALLALGIVVQLQVSEVVSIAGLNLEVAPISTMVVGIIVFLIAFFGCCGAIRESNCMLVTFSIFMLILMVLKIALATVIFVNLDAVVADVPRWLGEAFKDGKAFHEIEATFSCCGSNGPGDYQNITLPDTCCAEARPCTVPYAFRGCTPAVQDFFSTFGMIIGVIAIVVVSIELVAAVFGLCLANHVRNKYRRRTY